jgi:hypothetical protein
MAAGMSNTIAKYRRLDPSKVVETVEALQGRVESRFSGSGLSKIVTELKKVAAETVSRTDWIQKPQIALRCGVAALSAGIAVLVAVLVMHIRQFQFDDFTNSIQALDASISSVVFIGAAILFLVSWENRIKRDRALSAIHELRAMAHIVDMHQLTKDPDTYSGRGRQDASPPRRPMTSFELNRYLDYCSESLALISKIAALYVQEFQDPIVLDAVDDVEDLTSGLSRKIWQKITILENFDRASAARQEN